MADDVGEEREPLLGGRIDPVQILDHDDQRLDLGGAQRQRAQGAKQLAAPAGRVERAHAVVADFE